MLFFVVWQRHCIPKSCIVPQQKRCGTNYRKFMKEMTRSRGKSYKYIEDNLRPSIWMKKRLLQPILFVWMIFSTILEDLVKRLKKLSLWKKVLRSLPSRFNPKIYSIEELNDLEKLTTDELHRIHIAYEMRIEQNKPVKLSRKEASFKSSKKTNKEEHKTSDNS